MDNSFQRARNSAWVEHLRPWSTYDLPNVSCCYVLLLDNKHIYVGSTHNLRKRLFQYKLRPSYGRRYITPWGCCDQLRMKYRPARIYGDWLMVEARLLKRLKPSLNVRGGSCAKRWDVSKNGAPHVHVRSTNGSVVEVYASIDDFVSGTKLHKSIHPEELNNMYSAKEARLLPKLGEAQ